MNKLKDKFSIEGKVCIITGGAGLLGKKHCEAVLEGGGIPVLLGRNIDTLMKVKNYYESEYKMTVECAKTDITIREEIVKVRDYLMEKYGHIDILINNAANNPKMEGKQEKMSIGKFETFPIEEWNKDIEVGLTGTLLCCQIFGTIMKEQKRGNILNISSDYGIIAPDQRIYQSANEKKKFKIKPVSYSVIKHGIIGLSKYLATYWGKDGIRTNTLCPSGIYNGQDSEFVKKFINNVPMGRMSEPQEYVGTILYLISEASSFVNGATIVVDGGKTIW